MAERDSNSSFEFNQQRIYTWFLTFFGMILAVVIGAWIAQNGVDVAIILGCGILVVAWGVFARNFWWVFYQPFITLGGLFYQGIKIKTHEVAIAICLFPLILSLATRWSNPIKGRGKPPGVVLVLFFYLVLHMIVSIIYNKYIGLPGYGSVVRAYFGFLVSFVFFYAFYFYGKTVYLGATVKLVYAALLVRMLMNIYSFRNEGITYIPGVNFILPGSFGTGDLRSIGAEFAVMAFGYAEFTKKRFRSIVQILLGVAALLSTPFGGGRSSIYITTYILLLYLYVTKRLIYILPLFLLFLSGVIALNADYTLLEDANPMVARSLSGLIFDRAKSEEIGKTVSSNDWHEKLTAIGYKRWLDNPLTCLFGHGLRPFDQQKWDSNSGLDPGQAQVEMATEMGAFEAGFPTTLAVTGAVSFFLCLLVMYSTLSGPFGDLMRNKINSPESICYFWALKAWSFWIVFGAVSAGGFPSEAIFASLLAKTVYDDRYNQKKVAGSYVVQ
jgi:hypothetical protein